jgi:hypothetical protein
MTYTLNFLLAHIQGACNLLASEAPGALTERQRIRLAEIEACSLDLANTLTRYEMLCITPEMSRNDPRQWLTYAARTPLTMIAMSTRLLLMAHLQQGEPLTKPQHEQVRIIEISGQKLAGEIESLRETAQADR